MLPGCIPLRHSLSGRPMSRHASGFSIVVVSSAIVVSAIYVVLTLGASTARSLDTLWGDVDQRTLLVSAPRESILSPPMLVPDDLSILLTQSSIDIAVPAIRQQVRSIPGSERMGIVLTGVGPGYERLHLLYISSGRDLTADEIGANAHSVVINTDIANDVFEDEDAVGQIIRLDGRSYTVVGVFSSYMPVISAGIWMVAPLGSLKSWDEAISEALFWAKLTDEAAINVAAQDIVASFRERYPDKADVRAVAPTQMTDEIRMEAMRLVSLLGLIAGAATLLGATDVFNLVQVQLEQRRMELAIRRAVGSSNSQIALLGVLQGLRVAMFATPVGLASGIAGMALLANAMAMNLSVLSGRYLSLVTLIFIAIGAMSGGAAGWRASRGTPAEALRKGRA